MHTNPIAKVADATAFLSGGGDMGACIRAHDWSRTALGAPELWPQPLRMAVRLILNTPHPMGLFWGSQSLCFYNDALGQSVAPERPPALGQPASQAWDDIWPIIGPKIEQVMRGGAQESGPAPVTRHGPHGAATWTCSYSPIDDPTAVTGVGGVLVVCGETTLAEAVAETSLQRSDEQFRLLVKGVVDYAIYMLDPEGQVSSWNLGAQRIKGYEAEEVIGEHFSRFYTEEDRLGGVPLRGLETARREGRFETEGWRVRKDGTRFWAHVVIDAISDDDGELIGFAKVTRDVTERREAQQALETAREALYQSQKLEAIGQLTGGIAHDFNNLLMAVLGSLELVRRRLPDDPAIRRLIDNAMQGAQRGASLTQRMLAFARRQELKREPVDLSALVAGMSDLMERSIDPTYSIETRFPGGLAAAETDPAQLEAALLNLVVNARDAMPGGGVITISGRREEVGPEGAPQLTPGSYVCLSVSDTGEGMDSDTLARAAEPFFTTKGVGKGTGLGLSMIHGLASQSGGGLRLSSEPGQGATVELWLPVARAPQPAEPTPLPAASPEVDPLLILAVDDDHLVQLNTSAMLEDMGHKVLQAVNGEDALRLMRDNPAIDLLITDQAMPRMTGAQLAQTVRAAHPGLPIIIASGYAELPAGAAPDLVKLPKPFSQDDLGAAIAQARAGASTLA